MNGPLKHRRSETSRVGYGNPPEHTRFKPGQSGNPRGRPKGTLNMATVLERTLREKVVINEHGQRRTVTKLEAAIKQLVNKAATGDLRALRHLAELVTTAEERSAQGALPANRFNEDDQKVMQGILERFGNGITGGDEDEIDTE